MAQARLDFEPGRFEVLERIAQLVELGRRAVDFQALEGGDLQRLSEQVPDVGKMGPHAFGPDVAFPAENDVTVDSEFVEKVAGLL